MRASKVLMDGSVRLSPAARHLVDLLHLDTSKIVGTSKRGLISKSDIVLALSSGNVGISSHSAQMHTEVHPPAPHSSSTKSSIPAPSVSASVVTPLPTPSAVPSFDVASAFNHKEAVNSNYQDIPLTNMRKVIAKRLTESKSTVPHMFSSVEVEIDDLLSLRKYLKKEFDVNVSVNDIVVKCVALALRDFPEVNGKWDKASSSRVPGTSVDVSVAVATPTGLITPILFNADRKGVSEISSTIKELAGRAKEGKLKPEEYQGGSFSVSNLGMFGISSFSAVINPPQSCILAVGSGVSKLCPSSDPSKPPVVKNCMVAQLSADRRVVDEAMASQFLQAFKAYLKTPKSMLL